MSSIIFFLIFIPILSFILLSVNFIFAPHKPYKEKKTPFECGYHSFLSQNRTQFTISFFIFALLFLLFDLEIVLIYPFTVSSYANNIYGLIVMIVFTLIVTVGFIFELGKSALKIESKQNQVSSSKKNKESSLFFSKNLKIIFAIACVGVCLKLFPNFFFNEMEFKFLYCIYLGIVAVIMKELTLNLKGKSDGFNWKNTLVTFIFVALVSFLIKNHLPNSRNFLDFLALMLPSLYVISNLNVHDLILAICEPYSAKLPMGSSLETKSPPRVSNVHLTEKHGSNDKPDLSEGEAEAGPSRKKQKTDVKYGPIRHEKHLYELHDGKFRLLSVSVQNDITQRIPCPTLDELEMSLGTTLGPTARKLYKPELMTPANYQRIAIYINRLILEKDGRRILDLLAPNTDQMERCFLYTHFISNPLSSEHKRVFQAVNYKSQTTLGQIIITEALLASFKNKKDLSSFKYPE